MEHPLTPTIRMFFVCVAMLLVSASSVETGLLLLGVGFGWWKGCGCCGSGGTCPTVCSSEASTATIVVSGVANDICTLCDTYYNGIFVVPISDNICTGVTCTAVKRFNGSNVLNCGLFIDNQTLVGWRFRKVITDTKLEGCLASGCFVNGPLGRYAAVFSLNRGAAPIDCTTAGTYTLTLDSESSGDCDASAAVFEVTI